MIVFHDDKIIELTGEIILGETPAMEAMRMGGSPVRKSRRGSGGMRGARTAH